MTDAQRAVLNEIVAVAQRLLDADLAVTGKDARALHGLTGTLGAVASME